MMVDVGTGTDLDQEAEPNQVADAHPDDHPYEDFRRNSNQNNPLLFDFIIN